MRRRERGGVHPGARADEGGGAVETHGADGAADGAEAAVFAAYHRARGRALLARRTPLAVVGALIVVGVVWGVGAQPGGAVAGQSTLAGPSAGVGAQAAAVQATAADPGAGPDTGAPAGTGPAEAAPDSVGSVAGGAGPSEPEQPAAGDAGTPSDPEVAPPGVPEQRRYSIQVATRGFQAELDRCQWVRMDVGAVAPIVGAHNFCDGDLVLELRVGDLVTVQGTDLDGDYQVTADRNAHAGDDAATATAGLSADLLVQTCYWDDSGLRLVALRRVDLSLPPTPAAAP